MFSAAFDYAEDALGPVDILVNNAGIGNEQNWKLTMDVNVVRWNAEYWFIFLINKIRVSLASLAFTQGGAIRGTELAIERMRTDKDRKGGHVINIASISGLKIIPFGPFYSTSKAAIIQYTRTAGVRIWSYFRTINVDKTKYYLH